VLAAADGEAEAAHLYVDHAFLPSGRRRNLPLALVKIERRIQFDLAGQQFLKPRFVPGATPSLTHCRVYLNVPFTPGKVTFPIAAASSSPVVISGEIIAFCIPVLAAPSGRLIRI
jgi:hypothetical protein